MLIATVLSQNTNDKNSHRAYLELRTSYTTWDRVVKSSDKELAAVIRAGGMANQKSARIHEILRTIRKRYGRYGLESLASKPNGRILDELTSLKGVGVKTAACVLLFAFHRDVVPVDTHVHRICGRLGLTPGCKSPEQTFESINALIPRGKAYSLHINLIRFGRKICRSHHPRCGVCPLYTECTFERKSVFRKHRPASAGSRDVDFLLMNHV